MRLGIDTQAFFFVLVQMASFLRRLKKVRISNQTNAFNVSDTEVKYNLYLKYFFSGNTYIAEIEGKMFNTKDHTVSNQCAVSFKVGWYHGCFNSNLNILYGEQNFK